MTTQDIFLEILNRHLYLQDRNFTWLARRMNVSPATISRWANGGVRPSLENVIAIADILGIYRDDRQAMITALGYSYSESADDSSSQAEIKAKLTELLDISDAIRIFFGKWRNKVGLDRGKEGRWEVRLVRLVQDIAAELTPRRLLVLLLIFGLWWLTHWLVGPILQWPLEGKEPQFNASAKFGVATLLIPFLVALFMKVDMKVAGANQARIDTNQSVALLLIKVAGALAGFYILAFMIIAIALIFFYLGGANVSGVIIWLLVGLPLFSSYVCAYVIAIKRYEMFERIRLDTVDRIALLAFLVAGPFTAAFLYLQRDMLQNQYFGIILFVLFAGYVLWAYKQQYPGDMSNYLLIFIWGVFLPCLVLFPALWIEGDMALRVNPYDLVLFTIYVIGQGVLVATIYVRQQAEIFWPFLLWIFVLELLAILALTQDTQVGMILIASFGVLFSVIWILGKSRLHNYLWIHDSFWIMQIVFVASISAWGYAMLPPWLVALLYIGISALLVRWAFASGNQPETHSTRK